jgi:hypothetical protein
MRYGNGKGGSLHRTRVSHPERWAKDVLGNEGERLVLASIVERLKKPSLMASLALGV